jgi:hypothetical protein
VEVDFILLGQAPGEEVHHGEEGLEAIAPEASPRVEGGAVPVPACEVEAVVAAQGVPINLTNKGDTL